MPIANMTAIELNFTLAAPIKPDTAMYLKDLIYEWCPQVDYITSKMVILILCAWVFNNIIINRAYYFYIDKFIKKNINFEKDKKIAQKIKETIATIIDDLGLLAACVLMIWAHYQGILRTWEYVFSSVLVAIVILAYMYEIYKKLRRKKKNEHS